MSKNDERIMILKDQAEKKLISVQQVPQYQFKTNLIFDAFGQKVNFNTLDKEKIQSWMVLINSYCQSAIQLGFKTESVIVSDFSMQDWMDDLQYLYEKRNAIEETKKYKNILSKLNNLLSSDKKVELEVEELAKML